MKSIRQIQKICKNIEVNDNLNQNSMLNVCSVAYSFSSPSYRRLNCLRIVENAAFLGKGGFTKLCCIHYIYQNLLSLRRLYELIFSYNNFCILHICKCAQ